LDKIGHINQTKSVAAYAAELQHVIAPLNLDDDSLQSNFYRGLDGEIKKLFAFMPEAKNFDQLVDQCISIDQRYILCSKSSEEDRGKVFQTPVPAV
jgi:hypothetical protein